MPTAAGHCTVVTMSGQWMDPELDPRTGDGPHTDERPMLLDYLRYHRLTLQLKCDGLDAEQMARRSVPPSSLSLLGLVRHLADVERVWFREVLAGEDAPPHYWVDGNDEDFDGAVADDEVVAEALWAFDAHCTIFEQLGGGAAP